MTTYPDRFSRDVRDISIESGGNSHRALCRTRLGWHQRIVLACLVLLGLFTGVAACSSLHADEPERPALPNIAELWKEPPFNRTEQAIADGRLRNFSPVHGT